MKRYLRFRVIEHKPKTQVYEVYSSTNTAVLGKVFWWAPWRQYVFEPGRQTVWSRSCLKQVYDFIDSIMEARKNAA